MPVRRAGPLALAALLAAAGCKDVSKKAPADQLVLAAFDPGEAGVRAATIPLPNDLALQGAPGQAGVTREILFTYIGGSGWPGDQVITVPLRVLTYDAAARAYAPSATPPAALDTATVNASTVAIVRVSDDPPTVLTPELLAYGADSGNPALGDLRIRPKEGLAPGRYVVALRGGSAGVKTADGVAIGADQYIALIAPNKDLTLPANRPSTVSQEDAATLDALRKLYANPVDWTTVPSTATCVAALGLPSAAYLPEGKCWLPAGDATGVTAAFAAVDRVFPHTELASIQTFEVASPAVVADAGAGVLPFPSDFLLGADGKVREIASLGAAAKGLATLDGFSTTGLLLVPLSAPVKASTIDPTTVFLYDVEGGALLEPYGAGSAPRFWLQPDSMKVKAGGIDVSAAIGLQPGVPVPDGSGGVAALLPPLDEQHHYVVLVTDGVKDLADRPLVRGTLANLLLTVSTPLYESGASNVPGLSAADAAGLQAMRDALRPLVASIEGETGRKVVMAYSVTTQTVKEISQRLALTPYGLETEVGGPVFTAAAATDPRLAALTGSLTLPNVKTFLAAQLTTLDVLDAATGALDPDLATWTPAQAQAALHQVPVLVAVPAGCSTGSPCTAPLVVFHHGLNGSRYQLIAVADALAAKGFVAAAIDAPFHGDRAYCQADSDCAGGTCALDAANLKAPGVCSGGSGLAFDASRLTTVASGNYFISENFFRIRDVVRQDVLDQSALVVAAARSGATDGLASALAAQGVHVDPTKVYFAGISLGGMIGTSVVATSPIVSRAVLNVAGGTMVDVFTNAPAFETEIAALFAKLIPGFTPAKVDPTSAEYDAGIAEQYAQTLIVAKWILDPAEPLNYAADAADRADLYGQLVQGDPVVPNAFNLELYGNAGLVPSAYTLYATSTIPSEDLHGLLFAPTAAGALIRTHLADFLADPTSVSGHTGPQPLP